MMKYTPEVRSTSEPIASARSAEAPIASGRLTHRLAPAYCGDASASTYAASP
jgi:hypothetical protein